MAGAGEVPSRLFPPCLSRRAFLTVAAAGPFAASLLADARANTGAQSAGSFGLEGEAVQGGWLRGIAPAGTRTLLLGDAVVDLASDGRFLIAFDRDAVPEAKLAAIMPDNSVREQVLAIARRAWRIEQVNAPLRPGALPDAEYQRVRTAELEQIRAARSLQTGAQGWRQVFAWPAAGRISGRFGSQRIYQGQPGAYHSGLDIAGPTGTLFTAPADGTVILAAEAPFTLEGRLLMIDHGMGLNSAFLHCSAHLVEAGDRIVQGQPIGQIGATGRASGPHLHWSLKWRDSRLDPLLFLPPRF